METTHCRGVQVAMAYDSDPTYEAWKQLFQFLRVFW